MIRVLVADDHTLVRKGLKEVIEESQQMKVTAEAGNAEEVMAAVKSGDIDVVVLDIAMPGKSGLEILKELKALQPRLPVLMLSMYPEERYAVRVLRAGASGYLTKSGAPEELILAINKIAHGERYISAAVAEVLAAELKGDSTHPLHESLSDREYQVLVMIASGTSSKEIAHNLSLSPKTISTYRNRILRKMNVKSNAELIKYALENDLIE